MKKISILLFFAWPLFIVGQNKEYLVKHNGDTLYGKIELRNKIFILTNTVGAVTELNAIEVKIVHSENIKFNTVVPCKLHVYFDDIADLERYQFVNSSRDTLMILDEVYSTPKMNLYWGVDNFRRQYYFYKTPADPLPIQLFINYSLGGGTSADLEKTYVRGIDTKNHLEVQKGYINQLRLIMGDCKKISDGEWEILDYRIYSLKSVIKKYNKCK